MLAALEKVLPQDDAALLGHRGDLAALGQGEAHLHEGVQLILDGGDDQVGQIHRLADVLELGVELVQGDGGHGAAVPQIEGDLTLGGQGMHHVGDGTHHVHRVEHGHGLGGVGHADGDLVALPDAQGLQRLGAGDDLIPHFGVGGIAAHEFIGDVVGVALHDLLHLAGHGEGGVGQRGGDLRILALEPGGLQPVFQDLFFLQDLIHRKLPPSKVSPAPPGAPADT